MEVTTRVHSIVVFVDVEEGSEYQVRIYPSDNDTTICIVTNLEDDNDYSKQYLTITKKSDKLKFENIAKCAVEMHILESKKWSQ